MLLSSELYSRRAYVIIIWTVTKACLCNHHLNCIKGCLCYHHLNCIKGLLMFSSELYQRLANVIIICTGLKASLLLSELYQLSSPELDHRFVHVIIIKSRVEWILFLIPWSNELYKRLSLYVLKACLLSPALHWRLACVFIIWTVLKACLCYHHLNCMQDWHR